MFFPDGTPLLRCPVKALPVDFYTVGKAYYMLEKFGVLPSQGGWIDQSATLIEALEVINKEMAEYDDRRRPRH